VIDTIDMTKITPLFKAMEAASCKLFYASGPERWRLRREYEQALAVTDAERDRLRKVFASARGWLISKRPFSLEQLRTGRMGRRSILERGVWDPAVDHCEYYLWPDKTPAALVSHAYVEWERCVAFARKEQLDVAQLPDSWHCPGGALAIVFTRPTAA
jgi:hypothetical protein